MKKFLTISASVFLISIMFAADTFQANSQEVSSKISYTGNITSELSRTMTLKDISGTYAGNLSCAMFCNSNLVTLRINENGAYSLSERVVDDTSKKVKTETGIVTHFDDNMISVKDYKTGEDKFFKITDTGLQVDSGSLFKK